jgi:molybdenum cofactor guanylyltransferase
MNGEIKIAAIALAGGKSSRMGTDKALLKINGIPMLQQVCTVAVNCGADPIYIVSGWQERYQDLDLPSVCQFVCESEPEGALMGFRLGLTLIQPLNIDWIMLLACDLPLLKPEILQSWIDRLPSIPQTAIAYVPVTENSTGNSVSKKWEPLCALYRSSCLASLNDYINQGHRSFQGWLQRSLVVEIINFNPHMLFNCNTPEDLKLVGSVTDLSKS